MSALVSNNSIYLLLVSCLTFRKFVYFCVYRKEIFKIHMQILFWFSTCIPLRFKMQVNQHVSQLKTVTILTVDQTIRDQGFPNDCYKRHFNISVIAINVFYCIRKCNIRTLIFFKGSVCWGGAKSQWNFNVNTTPPLWKKDC